MKLNIIHKLILLILIILYGNNIIQAASLCSDKKLNGEYSDSVSLRIINQDTELYKSFDDSQATQALDFDERLSIYNPNTAKSFDYYKNNRLAVRKFNESDLLGWVNVKDMLCGTNVMINPDNHLESRVLVRTKPLEFIEDKDRQVATATVSHHYDKPSFCRTKDCRKLQRFKRYFVYAKVATKGCKNNETCFNYLLADKSRLEDGNTLVGWVNGDYIFNWNNSYGLRISESLPVSSSTRVCGYKTLEDAQNAKDTKNNKDNDCYIELFGGWEWYERSDRLYLQYFAKEESPKIYKVIAPVTTSRTLTSSEKVLPPTLGNLKRLDIMFLIDGTHSMKTSMEQVKETMEQIINNLPKNIQYRFAFQVYRDKYAKDYEFGDRYPFSQNCDANKDNLEKNKKTFIEKFTKAIQTTESDHNSKDDHYENLFGGLVEAGNQLRKNCREHMKLLFVLGDAGYSNKNQKTLHGRNDVSIEEVLSLLQGHTNFDNTDDNNSQKNRQPIISFFIQTKNKSPDNDDYKNAYRDFTRQANYIVKALAQSMEVRFKKAGIKQIKSEHLFSLNPDINKEIMETVKNYAQPSLLSDYQSRVDAGESEVEAINALIGDKKYGNVPAILFDQILVSECPDLESCKKSRKDLIAEFFIKESPYIVEDIWMLKDSYQHLLSDIDKLAITVKDVVTMNEKKQAITKSLLGSIEIRLGRSLEKKEKVEDTIAEIYQRLGIATPIDSPLFNFTFDEIEKLDNSCIISNILGWIHAYSKLMPILERSENALPVCGIGSIQSKEEAIRYFPPYCGRSKEEILKEQNKLIEVCKPKEVEKKYFNNLITLKSPYTTIFQLPSRSMSIYHNLGSDDEDKVKDAMWIPKGMLP